MALPDAVYLIFNVIGGIGIISAALFVVYRVMGTGHDMSCPAWLPHLVAVLWIVITTISYLRWTAETWASQGRLVFGALSPILVLFALGLTWWLPRRVRPLLIGAAVVFFAAVAICAPFGVIAPAYALPAPAESGTAQATFRAADGGTVALLGARISTPTVQPDEYVMLEIDWQIEAPFSQNWSLFVHLTTPDGVIVGQRDVYPGGGTLATGDLAAGYAWRNPVAVAVPSSAYAPETLTVAVGWYDLATGARLALPDGVETYPVGTVELQPRASDLNVPNPLSINFDNQIELVGYAMSDLTPAAGASFELTLYWRAIQPVLQDYTVFAHVIDPATTTIYAGSDSAPGGSATSSWTPGEIVEDRHTLTVNPDAPPGIYEVEIGLYHNPDDGTFPRLRIVTADGGMANDYTYLSRVRVLPRVQ
ncbi:MAG: hypothetical protein U0703_17365 [Anaerolineae bacterium]